MAKKRISGKGVEQKEARVVLTTHAMQKNVQQQFELVNAGLKSVKRKYNPEPEVHAIVGMVDTVPTVAKYVFKQVQLKPLVDEETIKDILKKVQPIYEQHTKGVINAQVHDHLALGYLGVDDVSQHVSKALGVVDEYVSLGDNLVH